MNCIHLPQATQGLVALITCHPTVACDVCDKSPWFDLGAGTTTLAVVLIGHVMFGMPATLWYVVPLVRRRHRRLLRRPYPSMRRRHRWLVTQSRPALFSLTKEMKHPRRVKLWRQVANNRFVDKLKSVRRPELAGRSIQCAGASRQVILLRTKAHSCGCTPRPSLSTVCGC